MHAGGGAGGDDGQLRGWGEGSRGRWRKPLRVLVHGKGPEGASLERRSGVLDTLESEQSIVGVNLGGVSARIYALRALDQVDLTIVIPNALCPRGQWQCPSDSDRM